LTFTKTIHKTISINAPVSKVWDALTNPDVMKRWYSDTELSITSDWKTGSPFMISGIWHGTHFENKGKILALEPNKQFVYDHLSSMSEIPDIPENYTVLDFKLEQKGDQTILTLTCSNLITEAIYGHMNFYWSVTFQLLKKLIEQ
jgi:uncharacterized protein YndB with AHSA1/START domain